MFKVILVAITAFYFVVPAHASALPPIDTRIVNAPKAQFIGSMVTSASGKFAATVTPANPQFKDCAACNAWLDSATLNTSAAKFTNAAVQAVWVTNGFLGYVGDCVDSNTGLSCSVPE